MAIYCSNCGKMLGEDARFCSACGRSIGNPRASGVFSMLMRPRVGRKIAGVCQGLANRFGWDPTATRVIAVILAVVTFPIGIIAYLILWLAVPEEPFALPPATPVNPAL